MLYQTINHEIGEFVEQRAKIFINYYFLGTIIYSVYNQAKEKTSQKIQIASCQKKLNKELKDLIEFNIHINMHKASLLPQKKLQRKYVFKVNSYKNLAGIL